MSRTNEIINSLMDFDKKLFIMRFGFNGEEPLKVIDIAEKFGVSASYISKKIIDSLHVIGRQL